MTMGPDKNGTPSLGKLHGHRQIFLKSIRELIIGVLKFDQWFCSECSPFIGIENYQTEIENIMLLSSIKTLVFKGG